MIYLKQSPPNLAKIGSILTSIVHDNDRTVNIITHLQWLLKKKDEVEAQEV